MGSLAGCLGVGGSDTQNEEPEPPWTTQQLKDTIDGDETLTIYAGTNEDSQWHDLIDVINDEYGTNLEGNVFASYGSNVSQRFIQERQANEDKADVLNNVSGVWETIRKKWRQDGKETAMDHADKYFETGVDEKFWFKDVLEDWHLLPFMVPVVNGGTNVTLPYNEDIFQERGLEPPEPYSELLDDKYEGMTMLIPSYLGTNVGFYMTRGADDIGVSTMEFIDKLKSHLNFKGAGGPTVATREIAKGNAPMMLFAWPNTVQKVILNGNNALDGAFPEGGYWPAGAGPVSINKKAPNPWAARFFVSAALEEPVQKRILNDVYTLGPVRMELDYSDVETNEYNRKRVNTVGEKVPFTEVAQYQQIMTEVEEKEKFKPA